MRIILYAQRLNYSYHIEKLKKTGEEIIYIVSTLTKVTILRKLFIPKINIYCLIIKCKDI